MNQNDEYTHFKSLPRDERRSGIFSDQSITNHHQLLRSKFFISIKRRSKLSLINFLVSLCLMLSAIVAFCIKENFPIREAYSVMGFFSYLWVSTFIGVSLMRICAYPSRKEAALDLQFIRAAEEHANNSDLIA